MNILHKKTCEPCKGGIPPLTNEQIIPLLKQIDPQWNVVDNHHLTKEYTFKNFVDALNFTNKVGDLAESEDHHPDIHLSWGKVIVTIWSHKINGLHENDFIFAAKCDQLP